MSVPIKIPDLGAADDQVTLVQWLVEVGDEITRGQKIVSIETDKAVVELESVAAGMLLKQCVAKGQDATVGDVIAYVGEPGDSVPETETPNTEQQGSTLPSDARSPSPAIGATRRTDADAQTKPLISPLVRNLARQKGVNLDTVVGTGAGGVITRQDVLDAAKDKEDN